jgi:hypothetical protein
LDKTTGIGPRRLNSWIGSFIEQTEGLGAPEIYRRWCGISTIGAALEQKVWLQTSGTVFPNFYIILIGHPGVGKSRSIDKARELVASIPEAYIAPISMKFASLVDCLAKAKRAIIRPNAAEPIVYNSMYICADELGAFIHSYDSEITDGLSALYENRKYHQMRRTFNIDIEIASPQINMLAGSTPQNLSSLLPEKAWGQGFMSRVILVFSDERIVINDFAPQSAVNLTDLEADLGTIANLYGQFTVAKSFEHAVIEWLNQGQPPIPGHPRLIHYNSRRKVNIYKLAMVSAVDRGNSLIVERSDFDTALAWLVEVEYWMPQIFKAGAMNADGAAMDEILHYIMISDRGQGVSSGQIQNYARRILPIHSIGRVIDVLMGSQQIICIGQQRGTGNRWFKINPTATD